jgi:hypothetical protein
MFSKKTLQPFHFFSIILVFSAILNKILEILLFLTLFYYILSYLKYNDTLGNVKDIADNYPIFYHIFDISKKGLKVLNE